MGMLGALAGVGRGLQDFSSMMNEKSKMDFLSQQEAIKHERALSLEGLRQQNNMAVTKYGDSLATTRQEQQNTFLSKKQEEQNKFLLEQRGQDLENQRLRDKAQSEEKWSIAKYGTSPEGIEAEKRRLEVLGPVSLENAKKEAEMKLAAYKETLKAKSDDDKRVLVEKANEYKKLMEEDGTPLDATESIVYASLSTGIDPTKLYKTSGNPITPEGLGKINEFLLGDERYQKGDMHTKLSMIGTAWSIMQGKKEQTGSITDPSEIIKAAEAMNRGNKEAQRDFFSLDLGTQTAIRSAQKLLENKTPDESMKIVSTNFFNTEGNGGQQQGMLKAPSLPIKGWSGSSTTINLGAPSFIKESRERNKEYMSRQKSQLQ